MVQSNRSGAGSHSSRQLEFARQGFLAPFSLFTPHQCEFIRRHLRFGDLPKSLLWEKAIFSADRVTYDLAIRPGLLALLRSLIGENIMLWGSNVLVRNPGDVHPWHTDIESSGPNDQFVSVWVGVQNATRASGLKLISGSHRYGKTLQEVASENGFRRGEASDEIVLNWARELDPNAALVQPNLKDGEAIIFDGRLWHGSQHTGSDQRIAALFQYAATGVRVYIPDLEQLEWPFHRKPERPPVILVSGFAYDDNNLVVAPPEVQEIRLETELRPIVLPLPENPATRWQPYHLFRGSTGDTQVLGAHVSVLSPGYSPHPPHAHPEEEILIVLKGEAEILIARSPDDAAPHVEQLHEGSFVFYPAYQHHTIRNSTNDPITYLMFKWRGELAVGEQPLETTFVRVKSAALQLSAPFVAIGAIEGPTVYLAKLHSHWSSLEPGAGYAAHSDDYDVALVILDGRVESMGRVCEPFSVLFYASGQKHDMKNIGTQLARYLVFEFHATTPSQEQAPLAIIANGESTPYQTAIIPKAMAKWAEALSNRFLSLLSRISGKRSP